MHHFLLYIYCVVLPVLRFFLIILHDPLYGFMKNIPKKKKLFIISFDNIKNLKHKFKYNFIHKQDRICSNYEVLASENRNRPTRLRNHQVHKHTQETYTNMYYFSNLDILTAITNIDESRHVVAALPTGSGKSIPQLLLSSLVSPGHKIFTF